MGQESLLRVVVGQIGAPFGIHGSVHVNSFTVPPSNILKYSTWTLNSGKTDILNPIKVMSIRPHGKKFVAMLEGCASREQAQQWTNLEITVPRETLPPLEGGEYYWSDLMGLKVFTELGEPLGEVSDLFETGANDVLVVKSPDRERLIPYIPDSVVKKIDLENRVMQVEWDSEF